MKKIDKARAMKCLGKLVEQVYYDPKAQVIFTVKRQLKKYLVIGGCYSPYIRDARTSLVRFRVTNAYFKKCRPIDETSHLLHQDRVGFRLRDDNQFYKVYNNPDYKYLNEETNSLVRANLEPRF